MKKNRGGKKEKWRLAPPLTETEIRGVHNESLPADAQLQDLGEFCVHSVTVEEKSQNGF